MPEAASYVLQWADEMPEHPVIAELRAQPRRWGIVKSGVYFEVKQLQHPNIRSRSPIDGETSYMLRWVSDHECGCVKS